MPLFLVVYTFAAHHVCKCHESGVCPGQNIDDVDRGDFLEYHNMIRRQIAQGVAQNNVGTLKPAKQMYELIYDCALEDAAAKSIGNICSGYLNVPPKHGQNKYTVTTPSVLALGKNALIPEVVASWYKPVMVHGLQNADNKFDDPRLESFANIAHDKNLGIGCYYAECPTGAPTEAVFSCVYNTYVAPNQVIYETGNACVDDSECTTYPSSICLDDLCVTPSIVSLPPTQAPPTLPVAGMCPGNPGVMTDAIRGKMLQMHNWRRSQLALGNIKNGRNNYNCPTASNMYKMAYDCYLEMDALAFASQCSLVNSPPAFRPFQGENVHVGPLTTNFQQTGEKAVKAWWSQIFRNGLNQRMLFTTNLRFKPAAPIAFTQMGWAMSVRIGCAIATCPTNTFTVCRYSAPGNIINEQIYIPGTPCAACPGTCIAAEGLCATP